MQVTEWTAVPVGARGRPENLKHWWCRWNVQVHCTGRDNQSAEERLTCKHRIVEQAIRR